jgi:hypothetical protein
VPGIEGYFGGLPGVRALQQRAWQSDDVKLRRYNGQGWRATFYLEGFEHSRTAYSGTAWAPSPWQATQRGAAETLHRLAYDEPALRDWTLTDESP